MICQARPRAQKTIVSALLLLGISIANPRLSHAQSDGSRTETDPAHSARPSWDGWSSSDIGYFVADEELAAPYVMAEHVRVSFFEFQRQAAQGVARTRVAPAFPEIEARVFRFIEMNAVPGSDQRNQISHAELAEKIVRAAFCFGTDPYLTAAKIFVESKFDGTAVSATNAVGLTQMTGIAIDEVHDQLGNRGAANAPPENARVLREAANCYFSSDAWASMLEERVVPPQARVSGNARLLRAAKNWLRVGNDRALIYGQMALKVYLANAYSPRRSVRDVYRVALMNYNGESGRRKVLYASRVLAAYRQMVPDSREGTTTRVELRPRRVYRL